MEENILIVSPSNLNCGPVNVARELWRQLASEGNASIAALKSVAHDYYTDIPVIPAWMLLGQLIRKRCRLLHTHGLRPDFLGYLAKSLRLATWVSTVHIDMGEDLQINYGWRGILAAKVWRLLLRRADAVVCLNYVLAEKLAKQLGRKVDVVFNGRSGAVSSQRSHKPRPLPVLGYLGAFIERKGVDALPRFLKPGRQELLLGGKGPAVDATLQELAEKGVEYNYLGQIADPEAFFAAIDVLILPSKSEGLPLVVIEAAARGIPAIVTDLPQYEGVLDDFCCEIPVESWSENRFYFEFNLIIANYPAW